MPIRTRFHWITWLTGAVVVVAAAGAAGASARATAATATEPAASRARVAARSDRRGWSRRCMWRISFVVVVVVVVVVWVWLLGWADRVEPGLEPGHGLACAVQVGCVDVRLGAGAGDVADADQSVEEEAAVADRELVPVECP